MQVSLIGARERSVALPLPPRSSARLTRALPHRSPPPHRSKGREGREGRLPAKARVVFGHRHLLEAPARVSRAQEDQGALGLSHGRDGLAEQGVPEGAQVEAEPVQEVREDRREKQAGRRVQENQERPAGEARDQKEGVRPVQDGHDVVEQNRAGRRPQAAARGRENREAPPRQAPRQAGGQDREMLKDAHRKSQRLCAAPAERVPGRGSQHQRKARQVPRHGLRRFCRAIAGEVRRLRRRRQRSERRQRGHVKEAGPNVSGRGGGQGLRGPRGIGWRGRGGR